MIESALISEIKNGGDTQQITSMIEGMLCLKVNRLLTQVKLQEAALILEADPTPSIFNDEKGDPVVPSQADWTRHYQDIAASHVKAQMDSAKARWADAIKHNEEAAKRAEAHKSEENVRAAKRAMAELKNLRLNVSAAERALKQKNSAAAKFEKVKSKKFNKNKTALNKTIHSVVHPLLGGSGLAHHISNTLANALAGHPGSNTAKS